MLTDEERNWVAKLQRQATVDGSVMCQRAVDIIDRLTSPRAVLDEAERLLRERRTRRVQFVGGTVSITGVRIDPPGGQQCGHGESYGQGDSLADAYKWLAMGEVST